MKLSLKKIAAIVLSIGAMTVSTQALAVYTINVYPSGADVIASGSGSLNLLGATQLGGGTISSPKILPGAASITIGPINVNSSYDLYTITGIGGWGPAGPTTGDSGTGSSVVGLNGTVSQLYLPPGYVSC